jgi:hypothetical protein
MADTALWKIFDTIDNVLKYAENKNTYILTFIGTQLTVIKFLNMHFDFWLKSSLLFLALCVFLVICSFFPKSEITAWLYYLANLHRKPAKNDNLLYFGDIVKYSVDEYIDRLEQMMGKKIRGNEYFEQLCRQIVINAEIANEKFNIFKASFGLMMFGELFFIMSLSAKF